MENLRDVIKKSADKCNPMSIFDFADGFVQGIKYANKWIDVKENTPDYSTEILLKFVNGTHEIGYYLQKKGHEDAFYSYIQPNIEFRLEAVTHWRTINFEP